MTESGGFMADRGLSVPKSDHQGPKWAAAMVRKGCYVHPLALGRKVPSGGAGVLDAVPDASAITGNYGVSMGASNLVGVDLDDYVEGNEIEQFLAEYDVPATFTVHTGSGGRSLYFRVPEGSEFKNRIGMVKGVDIRGNNGYMVGPGSKIAASEIKKGAPGDGTYSFDPEGGMDFAPLPPKLAAKLLEDAKPKEYDEATLQRTANAAAYEEMDSVAKQRIDAWLDSTVGGIMRELDAMQDWPDGYTERSRSGELVGWDAGVRDRVFRLAQIVNADWNPLGKDDVIGLLRQHLPHDANFTVKAGLDKFASAIQKASAAHIPVFEEAYDMLDGVEDRTPGKADGGSGTDEEVISSAKLVGGVQGHILFDTSGCRRIEVNDAGKEKEKEVLPATTARRLIESWPIAKQPLSKSQNWWVYKDGAWVLNDSVVRLSMAASFGDSYKTADVAPVEDVLSTMADEIEIEPHPEFINFRNGMLEWKTGELHEHSPAYKSTVQVPHDWNSDATCAGFDEWLVERLSPERRTLAWQLIAATLYSGIVSQRAGLLYGVGKSGKSTYLEVIQGLIGASNASALSPQAMTKTVFATHALLGKQANIVTDIDPTRITETAVFKQVVAGEPIQAQQKNKPEFTFRPFCNHLFSANQIPRSSDRTSAWTRRFAILRFTEVIGGPTVVVDRFDKILLREAEGIIAKALTFLSDLIRDGYTLVEEDQEEFAAATDFTRDFWADAVEISGNPLDFTPTTQLAQAFDMWCQTNRIRNTPPFADVELALRDNPIVERSRKRLMSGRGNNPVRGWKGVVLRPEYRPSMGEYDLLGGVPDTDA